MKSQLIHEAGGERTFVLVYGTGEPVKLLLDKFLLEHRVASARFTATGALGAATLGYFDWEAQAFDEIAVSEQVEVVSLTGDVAMTDGTPKAHAHVVLGRAGGSTWGGHLIEGHVRPTLELILVEAPAHLRRRFDPATGRSRLELDDPESTTAEPTDV